MLAKESEACPFKNIEYAFSYSTRGGAKVCQQPPSRLDTCTDEAKMVFQFQACPDVPGSERTGEFSTVKSAFTQLEQISTFFSPVLKGLLGKVESHCLKITPKKSHFVREKKAAFSVLHRKNKSKRNTIVKSLCSLRSQ